MAKDEARKLALDHAWKFFQLHAGQRLTLFNFFILIFLAGCTGFFGAIQAGRPFTAALISCLGILFVVVFKMLDARNNQLIKIAEKSLKEQEEKLRLELEDHSLSIFSNADNKNPDTISFRQAFNIVFVVIILSCITAFALSIAAIK